MKLTEISSHSNIYRTPKIIHTLEIEDVFTFGDNTMIIKHNYYLNRINSCDLRSYFVLKKKIQATLQIRRCLVVYFLITQCSLLILVRII